jgi:t-SNARE complex subunit (syntaxin)
MEMAALVSLQGEIIDNIESNVKSAKGHVFRAEVDIEKSKKNLQSARKVYNEFT